MGSSCNSNLYHNYNPNKVHIETHGMLQNLNLERETSSYGVNEKGKGKQPLGLEESTNQTAKMNLPNAIFEPPTVPSPFMSTSIQVSALNLPNSSHAHPTAPSPYMSAGTQVFEMNLQTSSYTPPRVPSPHVVDSTQVSEVNLPNSSYMPPYMAVNMQVSEMNLPNSSYTPARAPSPYMEAGTHGSEMKLTNSSYAASPYVENGTQVSQMNLPNSGYASPEVPHPYVSTGTEVLEMSLSSSSYAPPRETFPYVSAGTFQYPNSVPYLNENQDLASAYNSKHQNQLSVGATGTEVLNSVSPTMISVGVSGTTEVLNSAPATITSSNATNPHEFQTNISNGSQNLDPFMNQAPAAESPKQNESFSDYEDILRILDGDAANFNDFAYEPNLDEKGYNWLQKNLNGKDTGPY